MRPVPLSSALLLALALAPASPSASEPLLGALAGPWWGTIEVDRATFLEEDATPDLPFEVDLLIEEGEAGLTGSGTALGAIGLVPQRRAGEEDAPVEGRIEGHVGADAPSRIDLLLPVRGPAPDLRLRMEVSPSGDSAAGQCRILFGNRESPARPCTLHRGRRP